MWHDHDHLGSTLDQPSQERQRVLQSLPFNVQSSPNLT